MKKKIRTRKEENVHPVTDSGSCIGAFKKKFC